MTDKPDIQTIDTNGETLLQLVERIGLAMERLGLAEAREVSVDASFEALEDIANLAARAKMYRAAYEHTDHLTSEVNMLSSQLVAYKGHMEVVTRELERARQECDRYRERAERGIPINRSLKTNRRKGP